MSSFRSAQLSLLPIAVTSTASPKGKVLDNAESTSALKKMHVYLASAVSDSCTPCSTAHSMSAGCCHTTLSTSLDQKAARLWHACLPRKHSVLGIFRSLIGRRVSQRCLSCPQHGGLSHRRVRNTLSSRQRMQRCPARCAQSCGENRGESTATGPAGSMQSRRRRGLGKWVQREPRLRRPPEGSATTSGESSGRTQPCALFALRQLAVRCPQIFRSRSKARTRPNSRRAETHGRCEQQEGDGAGPEAARSVRSGSQFNGSRAEKHTGKRVYHQEISMRQKTLPAETCVPQMLGLEKNAEQLLCKMAQS